MDPIELVKHISYHISSIAHSTVGTEWNYKNITSSFSRLYLITDGEALVYIGDKKMPLKKGHLYLIPSFTQCSYICESEMSHYYATFTINLNDNLNIYQLFDFKNEIEASSDHYDFFRRIVEVNPNMELPATNPIIYQRINSLNWNNSINNAERAMVSSGLMYLLLSGFIGSVKMDLRIEGTKTILQVIKYIHANIEKPLTVNELASISCLSSGHFTRKFKQLTSLSPLDYINQQRIEKAQLLLNTTTLTSIEIAEACGYKTNAYFCKLFKKRIGQTPGEYRTNQV